MVRPLIGTVKLAVTNRYREPRNEVASVTSDSELRVLLRTLLRSLLSLKISKGVSLTPLVGNLLGCYRRTLSTETAPKRSRSPTDTGS